MVGSKANSNRRAGARACVVLVCLVGLLGGYVERVAAHPAPFSFVDITVRDQQVDVAVIVHIWDVAHEYALEDPNVLLDAVTVQRVVTGLGEVISGRLSVLVDGQGLALRNWTKPELLVERQSIRISAAAEMADAPGRLDLSASLFPYDPNHQTFLNFYESELTAQAILGGGDTQYEYFVGSRQGRFAVVQKFVPSGMRHILIGPDHLLFLLGLLLLGGTAKQLL
ncbi:uncharacterized protein METZ01_LOCUS421553, partial [marine metagenome]